MLAAFLLVTPTAAVVESSSYPSRRAALCTAASFTLGRPLATSAAAPIAKGAPAFGTAQSRTGLIDGIKSAFSEKTGEELAADYARSPADISGVSLPPAFTKARDVALIFHGSGGPDRETSAVLSRFREQDSAAGLEREVIVFDWMPWFTSNTDRLSFQSASVGASLGRSLASNPALRSLHIVGTSAGSFAADACSSAYVATARGVDPGSGGQQRAFVRLSLADPFAATEGASFQAGRGAQFFGEAADFAEHYLNTDDIVPNTKVPLPRCYCYDVTGCAERQAFAPPDKTGDLVYDLILKSLGYHSWPMGYLARHYQTQLDAEGRLVQPSHAEKPRGTVLKVA